jgi:hypothetical protein
LFVKALRDRMTRGKGMKKRDDLCIIDVALDKAGTMFLNLAYKLGEGSTTPAL